MRRALEANAAFRLPRGLQRERVQWLYDGAADGSASNAAHLLYWMQTAVRAKYNYALEFAIAAANALELPLRVVYMLADRSAVPAAGHADPNAWGFTTERHAKFALEGLLNAHQRLHQRGLQLHVLRQPPASAEVAAPRDALLQRVARDAALVVTDRPYLRPWREALDDCASTAATANQRWALVQVESDVVVPCEVASDKEEHAARTIRPRITRQLPKFLVELEHLEVAPAARSVGDDADCDDAQWLASLALSQDEDDKREKAESPLAPLTPLDVTGATDVSTLLAALDVDRSVRGVSSFTGGESVAVELAKSFLEKKLAKFADERNEPSGDGGSNLSIYLRHGHISPVRVALAAKKVTGASAKAGREAFLEELIVRRELSINLTVFNQHDYDSFACLPAFAKRTLADHAGDAREHLYSLEQLEAGRTSDVYWNAAQMEIVATGKMHGYMRMYWAKKLLEWTATPQEGYRIALFLNNKYGLDAPDPNSYTGIAWAFGKHDQGWKERPIFGKVRYMNEAGLKRKFRMDAYVRKAKQLLKEYDARVFDPADENPAELEGDGERANVKQTEARSGSTVNKTSFAQGSGGKKRKTLESFWQSDNKDAVKPKKVNTTGERTVKELSSTAPSVTET